MKLLKELFLGLRSFLRAVGDHALFSHAAATAFYLFFSIPPAILALVSLFGSLPIDRIAGWVLRDGVAIGINVLSRVTSSETAKAVRFAIERLTQPLWLKIHELGHDGLLVQLQMFFDTALPPPAAAGLGKVMGDVLSGSHPAFFGAGMVGVVWSASGVTRQMTRAMNVIYEVKKPTFFVRNLSSLALTTCLLLIVCLTIGLLPLLGGTIEALSRSFGWTHYALTLWKAAHWALVLWIVYASLMLFYRYCVNVRLKTSHVRPGVILTILLWVSIGYGVKLWSQFGYANYNATYGALAGVILALFWCYLMSVSILLGVEFNANLAYRRGIWSHLVGARALPWSRRQMEAGEFLAPPGISSDPDADQ